MRRSGGTYRGNFGLRLVAGTLLIGLVALVLPAMPDAAATGTPSLHVSSTVSSATVTPVLNVGLAPVAPTAIPGDQLSYTATVTNTGATVTLAGTLYAQATPDAAATVGYYFEDVGSTSTGTCPAPSTNDGNDNNPWTALAGVANATPGFAPDVIPPSSTGIQLRAVPLPESGVTYPAAGDRILGTTIAAGATAEWSYTATVTLTPQQVAQLLDPSATKRVRNQFHFEPVGEANGGVNGTGNTEFCNQLAAGNPSGTVSNTTVTISLPSGSPAVFNPTTTPALAQLVSGASASVTATYTVPAPPAKGSSTDSAYLSQLQTLNGSSLVATASASGSSNAGTVTATSTADTTTEQLPILGITKSGPVAADPGSTASYPLALQNGGGATAASLAVSDSVAGGATGTVTGVPSTLAAGGSAGATATYAIPSSQAAGPLGDTASVTWSDANGNSYGPVSSSYTTTVNPPPVPPIVGEIASEAVQGNFYAEPSGTQTFVATPADTPVFGQQFPTVDFNPPSGVVNGEPTGGPAPGTRPFTDVTTDEVGNYAGTIVAQGNGSQAGTGSMHDFDAVFTSSFIVSKPGDITFNVYTSDGFLLGVGNGATRVNGSYENAPASNTSPFQGYPLAGAFDEPGGANPGTYPVTVNFPAAGVYPYELDYFDCCAANLSLTMTVATFNAQTSPLSVFVGYADGLRPAGSIFPFPWRGSPNVIFEGCQGGCTFDGGAIRLDNAGTTPMTVNSFSVDFGSCHYAFWPSNLTLPGGDIMIFAQEASGATSGCDNGRGLFDTSDLPYAGYCGQNGIIPQVNVTIDGVEQSFTDSQQILDTHGHDVASCPGTNESEAWQRIGGGGVPINVPLPPAATLTLTPGAGQTDIVGQSQQIGVSAMTGGGQPDTSLPVQLSVYGANTQSVNRNTDASGDVSFSYTGTNAGSDTVEATALIGGLLAVSNSIPVTWNIPIPNGGGSSGGTPAEAPPAISAVSPPDGTVVTQPVPITASFTPPTGETITSWSVTYQAAGAPNQVTLASGTGAPPASLATFDPTLLPNNTYTISVSATDSGGGTQVETESLTVAGNLKLGRYVTTYKDLTVPVSGIPMTVDRTYDSTDKSVGDFGVGWHVSVSNYKVATNRAIGAGGWSEYPTQCFLGLCIYGLKTSAPHYVTVTWPSGRQEVFDFTPSGGQALFYWEGTAGYTARSGTGTTSTLAPVPSQAGFSYGFDGNLYSGGQIYDPTEFQLTTATGQVLLLSTTQGLVSETDPNGNSITVDSGGIHSSNGQSILYTRDGQGRITQITAPGGSTLEYAYDASGNLASFTDADGNVTTYTYDAAHDLTGAVGPDGPLESLTYDASGRLTSITDGNGQTTQIADDVAGRQQVVTDASGKLTTVETFDALGDVLSSQQIAGGRSETTTYTYDSSGHMLTATDPKGDVATYTYDSSGNLTSVTNPDGNKTTTTYNSFGEPTAVTGPNGEPLQSYTYDGSGNLTSVTVGGLYTDQITENGQGQPVAITNPEGLTTTMSYDSAGHLTSTTDPSGAVTKYQVDALGHILAETDPDGNVTTYGYDAAGNRISVTDPAGGVTSLTRNGLGQIASQTDPMGQSTTYQYDGNGNLTTITTPDGRTTTYAYDVDGRVIGKTLPDGTSDTYTYDGFGRLVSASNPTATDTMTYDSVGRLASTTSSGPSQPTATLAYTYDAAGNPTSMTGPGGTTSYSWSDLGQMATETDPAGGSFTFTRNAAGQLTAMTRPNGVDDTYSYDADGNMTAIESQTTSQILQDLAYTYDADGRRLSSTDSTGTTTYVYDKDGHLISASLPGGSTLSYAYDADGNPTETPTAPLGSLVYNADNELTSGYGSTYTYDGSGDLTQATDTATSATTSYTWAAPGQLSSVSSPAATTSYGYDPLGRRVTSTSAAGTTASVYSGASLVAQVLPAGGGTQTYVPGPGLNVTMELAQPNGTRDYYLTDALGSTTALTDSAGAVADSYGYTPYGTVSSSGSVSNPLTFTGQQSDPTGLYYMHDRYYDPTTQRFISPDPAPSSNAYTYVAGDPVNLTDPTGAELEEYAFTLKFAEAEAAYVQGLVNGISNYIVTCVTAENTPGANSAAACSPDFLDVSILYSELQAAGDFGIGQIEGFPAFQALGGAAFDGLAAEGLEGMDLAVMGEPLDATAISNAGNAGAQASLETWGAGFALGQFGKLFPSDVVNLSDVFSFVGGFVTGAALSAQATAGALGGGG